MLIIPAIKREKRSGHPLYLSGSGRCYATLPISELGPHVVHPTYSTCEATDNALRGAYFSSPYVVGCRDCGSAINPMMLPSRQITRTATSNVVTIHSPTLGNLPNFSDIGSLTKSPLLGKLSHGPVSQRRTSGLSGRAACPQTLDQLSCLTANSADDRAWPSPAI